MKIQNNFSMLVLMLLIGLASPAVANQNLSSNDLVVGVRIAGTIAEVDEAIAAGAHELLVEFPTGEEAAVELLKYLETKDVKYSLTISQIAPSGKVFAIEPESYRFENIENPTRISTFLAGCDDALVLTVLQKDGTLMTSEMIRTTNGQLNYTVTPKDPQLQTALIYPIMTDVRMPDSWDAFDRHRDRLLRIAKRVGKLTKLRSLINPMGQMPIYPGADSPFVPIAPRFRMELAAMLKERYGSIERVEQAWLITASDLKDFDDAAQLVPLWGSKRGVNLFWHTGRKTTYTTDRRSSAAWRDIREVCQSAIRRRYENLVRNIKIQWDVPVMQDWIGWNGPYSAVGNGLDGVGVQINGDSLFSLLSNASRVAWLASDKRFKGSIWATDVRIPANSSETATVRNVIEDSLSLGVTGWYFAGPVNIATGWLNTAKTVLSENSEPATQIRTLAIPEAAMNPAVPMRLESGLWWTPSPLPGDRVDLGRQFAAYRYRDGEEVSLVIWRRQGMTSQTKLRISPNENILIRLANGSIPKFKKTKTEIIVELGSIPLVMTGMGQEVPVPEEALNETLIEFTALTKSFGANQRGLADEAARFSAAASHYKQQPTLSFTTMRKELERLKKLVGPIVWVEAELIREHNFSEVINDGGASGGAALSLENRLRPADGYHQAKFTFTPRINGPQEIWMSVKGSPITAIQVNALGQILTPQQYGASYGTGYRWVKFGVANLGTQSVPFIIRVPHQDRLNLQIDLIALTPEGTSPGGIEVPWYLTNLPQ